VGLLVNPVEKYKMSEYPVDKLRLLLAVPEMVLVLSKISTIIQSTYPKTTPQQEAWDALTKMEARLDSLEKTLVLVKLKALISNRSTILRETFTSSRNSVLKSLYDSVRDRFVELYGKVKGIV
jgi:hypothetical protein